MEDLKTVHYVTQDPLQNLKIKISLTRLSYARSKVSLTANTKVQIWFRAGLVQQPHPTAGPMLRLASCYIHAYW